MKNNIAYCFVDPINSTFSGITRYTHDASNILRAKGINNVILSKNRGESLNDFRLRVSKFSEGFRNSSFVLEAPETLASSIYVSAEVKTHIRLHFSKVFGAFIEGKYIDRRFQEEEQRALNKAKFVSSPSVIGAELAKRFYTIDEVSIFQNPLNDGALGLEFAGRDFDVGFVGRWQALKGVFYVKRIVAERPDLRFIITADAHTRKVLRSFPNVRFVMPEEKALVYLRSRCVIVPSYFETASMVAIEAVQAGAKVVTWKHIGVCEYLDQPYVYKANPFDWKSLLSCIDSAASDTGFPVDSAVKVIESFNEDFLKGLSEVISGKVYKTDLLDESIFASKIEFEFLNGIVMKEKKELSSFERKFRKLRKHPIMFFRDAYKKKKGHVYVPSVRAGAEAQPLKNDSRRNKGRRRANIFCDITDWSTLRLHDYGRKDKEFRAVFLFDKEQYKSFLYKELLEKIYAHEDFMPLRRSFSGRGYLNFESFPSCMPVARVVDRVSFNERCKITNISVLFLFDCYDEKIFEFFRSASPFVKLVAVYTEEKSKWPSSFDSIDCLIVPESFSFDSKVPKLYLYSSLSYMDLIIRKVMQEYIPRSPNYLLPLYGKKRYFPEIESFDRKRWAGVLIVKKSDVSRKLVQSSFNGFVALLTNAVVELYVREDVYLAYKSVCDDIYIDGNLAFFLQRSLKDGYMYDVKEV